MGDLGGGEVADFASAAGVDGVELGGEDGGVGGRGGGGGGVGGGAFVGEEALDEVVLESGGVGVVDYTGEAEVGEAHWGDGCRGGGGGGCGGMIRTGGVYSLIGDDITRSPTRDVDPP